MYMLVPFDALVFSVVLERTRRFGSVLFFISFFHETRVLHSFGKGLCMISCDKRTWFIPQYKRNKISVIRVIIVLYNVVTFFLLDL